ncbi:MAG: AAA family ATPase [Bacteroidetes bacterium]|nr:AAA family ATPase [Bacteroidota bacterium]
MTENFITNIFVENSRNIKDLEIPLSNDRRQHLILTGKNGSGKTSLLLEINKFLAKIDDSRFQHITNQRNLQKEVEQQLINANLSKVQKFNLETTLIEVQNWFLSFGGTQIKFSGNEKTIFEKSQKGEFLLAFFDSKRHTNLNIPKGINKINLRKKYSLNEKANSNFIQYIVNLKADRSFARDDNEKEVVEKIDKWFERLENRLKQIFDVSNLELRFNRKSYNFDIITNNNTPFNFNNLSDGYSAIISIVTELLLRMEAHEVKTYDLEGIVIIDEIETHLHVDLQKKILPFLTDFFPKLQFIVSTHSPFVLSSLSNTTICDLETRTVTTDLSGYSYDALIESYFQTDKYSEEIKSKIIEFDKLTSLKEKTNEQLELIRILRNYFAHTPKYLSNELLVKLQQIELNELNNKK